MQNCHILHDYLITQIEISQTLYIPEIVSESFWVVNTLEKIKGLIEWRIIYTIVACCKLYDPLSI